MSSDQERGYNSSDNEGRKWADMSQSSEERAARSLEDLQEMKPGMRYYPNAVAPQVMMHRGDPMMRPGMMGGPRGTMSEDSDLTDAMVFLNRIKEEYTEALPVYDSFLETMRDFKFGKIDADEVCKAVRILFKEKPFLVRQFDEYLPHHLRFNDGRGFAPHQMQDRHAFSQYRMGAYNPPMPMGRPHTHQMPPPMHMGRVPSHTPPVYMSRPDRGGPHSAGVRAMPAQGSSDVEAAKHRMANDFIQLVKKTYAGKPIVYKQFIELLQNSKHGFDKLLSQVASLLVDTPELIEKFEKNFRPSSTSDQAYCETIDPLKAMKDKLAEKGVLEVFLKAINFYNQNYINADDLVAMLEPIIDEKENIRAFKEFIKYEEAPGAVDLKRLKDYEMIGSYKIFPQPLVLNTSSALAREVLNNACISVSILESEDGYVFRNKNNSEELLARIGDERSESDLKMGRLRYLITKLEELFSNLGDDPLEMDDIEMSAALIKETLRSVYDSKSNEVLEAIISTPKRAIPVVLTRLHKVYKESAIAHRRHKKFWRNIVDENYYKAYDTRGVFFRSDEKNLLSLKHIHAEASMPLSVRLADTQLLDFIKELYSIMVLGTTTLAYKRIPADTQTEFFNDAVAKLQAEDNQSTVEFDFYALCVYIVTLYARFEEIKALRLPPIVSSETAVKIGYQEETNISDRFAGVELACKQVLGKEIDPDTFEDRIRQLTDSCGFKLYNLKKIFSKVEKQVVGLIDQSSTESSEKTHSGSYAISNNKGIVTLCAIDSVAESLSE